VWGLDKYLKPFADPDNNEVPMAVVSTTQEDCYSATVQIMYEIEDSRPDPGPGNRVFGDGPYVIRSRLGDVAVVAMGGIARIHPESGEVEEFRPMRMGVRRFLFGITGERIENADIELNIPLSQVASLRFDDPPIGVDAGSPNTLDVRPCIMFDAEGAWPLWEYVGYAGDPIEAGFDMPNMPALVHGLRETSLAFLSSLYTFDAVNLVSVPFSENYLREVTSLAEEIDVTPWMGIPRLVQPEPGGEVPVPPDRRLVWEVLGGSGPPAGQLLLLFVLLGEDFVPVWQMFLPGHLDTIVYPPLPELEIIAPGSIGAFFMRTVWREGLDIDSFEYNDFMAVLSVSSWSNDYDIMSYHQN